eukprot:349476_1
MASRVLWLLFSLWAVFLPMFAFAAEHKSDDVNEHGASDERIDWMGMSREKFIGKYPPGTVHNKELLLASDESAIYALDGRQDTDKLSIGMSLQLCDVIPEDLENNNLSKQKRVKLLRKARKVLVDHGDLLMFESQLRHKILLYRRARVMFQLCLKGGEGARDAEIRLLGDKCDTATKWIKTSRDDLELKWHDWFSLLLMLAAVLFLVGTMLKDRCCA